MGRRSPHRQATKNDAAKAKWTQRRQTGKPMPAMPPRRTKVTRWRQQ